MSDATLPFPLDVAVRVASEDLPRLRDDLEHNGLACIEIALGDCEDKETFMVAMARGLRYPDQEGFGANWDALSDVLGDLGWWPATGYGLILDLRGFALHAHHGLIATLADVLRDARAFWQTQDIAFVPFYVLD